MNESHSRQGVTLTDVIVIIFVVGVLLCMLIPGVMRVRKAARQAACISTLKLIGLSLHNYHDAHNCFPPSMLERPASDFLNVANPIPGTDNTNGNGADFSWNALLIPHMEELTQNVNLANCFPFDNNPDCKKMAATPTRSFNDPIRSNGPELRCASYTGPDWSTAPEYPAKSAAIGNYVTLGATHLASLYRTETRPIGGTQHPNGSIYPGSKTSIDDITDGSTNTFVICETREQNYAAWVDGTTAAVVGLAEQTRPKFEIREGEVYYSPAKDVQTTLNWGSDDLSLGKYYLPAVDHSGSRPWIHGPSSFHPGIINHLLGDCSVRSVEEGIDPKLYMHLITRSGNEPVNEFFED